MGPRAELPSILLNEFSKFCHLAIFLTCRLAKSDKGGFAFIFLRLLSPSFLVLPGDAVGP